MMVQEQSSWKQIHPLLRSPGRYLPQYCLASAQVHAIGRYTMSAVACWHMPKSHPACLLRVVHHLHRVKAVMTCTCGSVPLTQYVVSKADLVGFSDKKAGVPCTSIASRARVPWLKEVERGAGVAGCLLVQYELRRRSCLEYSVLRTGLSEWCRLLSGGIQEPAVRG